MIQVTRFDGRSVVVNADLILTLESTPDTVVALVTGASIMVRESVDDVVQRVIDYRQRIAQTPMRATQISSSPDGVRKD
jgi:flagellar protein FlbD